MSLRAALTRTLRRTFRRTVCTKPDPKKRVWDKSDVEAAAAARKRHEMAVENARWASSWMMPWERAQMDSPTRPLKLWERVYWQLFVVLGGVGLVYETWVLGNRRIWNDEKPEHRVGGEGLYNAAACTSTRLLTDEDLEAAGLRRE